MKTVHVTAFAYDVLDRLIAESGFNHKLTGYHYNAGNELVEQRELGDDASLAAKLIAQLGGQPVPPPKKRRRPAFRRPRKPNPLRLGRQPPLARNPPERQIYLHLRRPRFLRTAGASPRLDNRRRRKPTANQLFPLRPHRHPARNDR